MENNNLFTLINCIILTMDNQDRFYSDGVIVVEDNKIAQIGMRKDIISKGKVIDMRNKLVLPGLINTHTHSPSPLFRGMADDLRLMDWLKKLIWPAERHLTKDYAYWGASLSYLEFLHNGITTFADQYFFSESIAEAAQHSGLRAFIAATVFSNPSPETEDTIDAAIKFIQKYKGREEHTLVYPCIGPHAPYSCSSKTLQHVKELSEIYDLLIHIHISETADENEEILRRTGLTPTKYLDRLGLFQHRVLAAHCIHLDSEDIDIFSKNKVKVSYNPVSNLKLVSGIMPMKEMLEKGIVVSIGTDGAQSNNSLDLLRDLKTGVLMQKQINTDATFMPARDALRMATIKGAEALGMEDKIGSLEIGKLADIIAIDLEDVSLNPYHRNNLNNMYSAVVYSACGMNVSDVIVNGKFLMIDRTPQRVNSELIKQEASKAAVDIMSKAGLLK